MNRQGFAYLIAVLILGLLAFMGLFLAQSSSAEYSQAAISVYRTMGRQLAEAAADEAYVMLEERFKDKSETGFMQQLLWQASTSQTPKGGGATGLNPTLLHDFSDLKDKITQTLTLKNYHMTRAGFTIEKILPNIKGCRPIPQGPLDDITWYHRSPDRKDGFDNHYSRDWYLVIQLDITVALQKQRKFKIDYTISRDVKLLNLGPIARNYTLFSINGHRIPKGDAATVQATLRHEMNMPNSPGGRLILWNTPFQSRVYLHGPSIINLENPELGRPGERQFGGGYNIYDPKYPKPGENQAFQYSDTFYGMSYLPTMGRAIFPSKTLWDSIAVWWRPGKERKSDKIANRDTYLNLFTDETAYGGLLPHRERTFGEILGDISSRGIQDTYFRGSNVTQKFLPGGPFCRTPWKYVSTQALKPLYAPNQKPRLGFPEDDEHLRIEHRWLAEDATVAEQSKIYARTFQIKYNNVTNNIRTPIKEELMEFSLSYYNDSDPEGFLGKLGYSLSSIGESFWRSFTMPFEAITVLAAPLVNKIWPGKDSMISAAAEQEFKNLFPNNFKLNFRSIVTRKMADESEIPRDAEGRWLLNGVYWLDSCQIENSVTYVGTGTIVVSQYNPERPFKVRGSIVSLKADDKVTPLGHLNIFYNPSDETVSDTTDRMLIIEGYGNVIEASVYSCYGIRTTDGDVLDMTRVGIYSDRPTNDWDPDCLSQIIEKSNVVFGNYVNFYMCKNKQEADLWIVHNNNSPLYFNKIDTRFEVVQKKLDEDEENRKAYELMTHEFFMSPKIMHVASMGGSGEDDE